MAESNPAPAPSKASVFVRRTTSTLLLWGLVTTIFLSHRSWAFLGLMGVLSTIALVEYFRMLRAAGIASFPRATLLLGVGYMATLYLHLSRGGSEVPFAIDAAALFLVTATAFTLQLRRPITGPEALIGVATSVLGFIYIPFLFNFTARVTFLVQAPATPAGTVDSSGALLLVWLLAVTKFTDMGAYITGSIFGRHKMIPHISPGKTWEGFAGAILFSQLAACGLYAAFPSQLAFFHHWTHVAFLGALLAILAVIGDLAESVVKRSLAAKDSGRMLPGIGGSLDLIDSICFTAPALYFYLKWILLPTA